MNFTQEILNHASQLSVSHLVEMAIKDPLTQLFNRNSLYSDKTMDIMLNAVVNSHGEDEGCAIAIIDLDRFKSVNDCYGHAAGDQVLTETARLIQEVFSENTLQCRYGGEEFVLIHAGDFKDFYRQLEEFHAALPLCDMKISDGYRKDKTLSVTASIGVAEPSLLNDRVVKLAFDVSKEPPERRKLKISQAISYLIQPADDAVYFAKNHGRNRIVTASETYNVSLEEGLNITSCDI